MTVPGELGWERRAALGEELAADLDRPGAEARIMRLLLDPEDTAVTFRTALALLSRRDIRGVRLVAWADSRADDQRSDHLCDAFAEIRAESLGADDNFLREALSSVAAEDDAATAWAARALLRWMGLDESE